MRMGRTSICAPNARLFIENAGLSVRIIPSRRDEARGAQRLGGVGEADDMVAGADEVEFGNIFVFVTACVRVNICLYDICHRGP